MRSADEHRNRASPLRLPREEAREIKLEQRRNTLVTAVAGGAVTCGYFLSPLLEHARLDGLLLSGLFIGGGVFIFWLGQIGRRFQAASSLWVILLGMIVASATMIEAVVRTEANEQQCLEIRADMLTKTPRFANGPDVYMALRCRP